MRRGLIFSVAITLVLFAVYYQVSDHSFLDFDDNEYVVENPAVNQGLRAQTVPDAFKFTTYTYWHPVTTISYALDVSLFGVKARPLHLLNLLFHIYVVLLCFWFFFLATGKFGPSAFLASLLALHPLNVEAVAWIAEKKTMLSGFFVFISALFYLLYARKKSTAAYAAMAVFFALALMSKPSVVPMALIFLALDYWPLYRTGERGADGSPGFSWQVFSRLLVEKIPLFIMVVIVIIVVSKSMQPYRNIPGTESFALHLKNAFVSYPRYMLKLIWPDNLAVFYPWPKSIPIWQVACSIIFLLAVTYYVFREARRMPYLLVGWLWFVVGLGPVLGLAQGGLWPAWADRFVYFPEIGLFLAVAFLVDDLADKRGMDRSVLMPAGVLVALCLAAVTWVETGFWKNDFTLFSRAAAVTEGNFVALTKIGTTYAVKGDYDKALPYYRKAIAANPNDFFALRNMGDIFFIRKDFKQAEKFYRKSIEITKEDYRSHKKYARLLSETGRPDKAIEELDLVMALNPGDFESERNLGLVYQQKGDLESAILHFKRSLALNPGYKSAQNSLDRALAIQKLQESVAAVKKAIAEKGETPERLNGLAKLYIDMDEPGLALEPLSKAVALDPGNVRIWSNYGVALYKTGATAKSREALEQALRLDSKNIAVHYNLACLASVDGNIEDAADWIQKAVDLGFSDWQLLAVDPDLAAARKSPKIKKMLLEHSAVAPA